MLRFKRTDSQVIVHVDIGVLDHYYDLNINCQGVVHAELLKEAFDKHMRKRLKKIREDAYNDGWKDAKNKAKKKDWFITWW